MRKVQPFAPSVRLALAGAPKHVKSGLVREVTPSPGILVSYVWLQKFDNHRKDIHFRDWVMDSGAFSAHNSGQEINLQAYTDVCKERLATDPQLTEVFALDVIGDWRGSVKNTERMWAAGVPAIPTYHQGEPWDLLTSLAKQYPKIALGGMVGLQGKGKADWVAQCFARVWRTAGPKKIHGLGLHNEKLLHAFPFHSSDSSNWEITPTRFGSYLAYNSKHLRLRGADINLRVEVERHMQIEASLVQRWRREMQKIDPAGIAAAVAAYDNT